MQPIYLDNNATTRPATEVVEHMHAAMREWWANPSSVHRAGQHVRQQIELARESVCRLIGCQLRELVFTSGGTESTNLALRSALEQRAPRRVVVSSGVEHAATREAIERLMARGDAEGVWLPLDAHGLIDVEEARSVITHRANDIAIVSIQWVNNETGAIQPVEAIGAVCRELGVLFHCDATQWVGKMPTNLSTLPFDLMTFSAHKFHGPKGIGGLFVKSGVRIQPQICGGPQERDRRGGTENVAGIIGMGVAADLARNWIDSTEPNAALRDQFEGGVLAQVSGARINQRDAPRIWNTSNIAFPDVEAETMLLLLSERGVYASAGAACSSGSLDPSPVLLAMGIEPEVAQGSVRFSLSRETTESEVDRAIEVISEVAARLSPMIHGRDRDGAPTVAQPIRNLEQPR